jgi:phosphate transport system substrate-binding protein
VSLAAPRCRDLAAGREIPVIDRVLTGFLNSPYFSGRAPRISRMRVSLLAAVLAAMLSGCTPRPAAQHKPEDDLTTGTLAVVCSPEARDVVGRAAAAFQGLYPAAHVTLEAGSSRDAIAALFGARANMAVITRDLVPEERKAAVQGRLQVEGYRFARDAAVLVVNPANPVDNLTIDDVRRIYRGDLKRWSELGGGAGDIEPVVQPPAADVTEFFIEEVLAGEDVRARSLRAADDADVVRTVREHPGAIGYVTLGGVTRGARAVRLAALKGLPYYAADLENVHEGRYPVTRYHNMYVRMDGPPLANGFITYVTSVDGQRIVRDAGFVPTSVPVRFVRRSPMRSTHTPGDSVPTP